MGKALARFINKVTKENLWIYVMSILLKNPLSGYDIVKRIRGEYGINVTTVAIYVVLYKMERDGLIESYVSGEKKYYRPTKAGIEEFRNAIDFLERLLGKFGCRLECGQSLGSMEKP